MTSAVSQGIVPVEVRIGLLRDRVIEGPIEHDVRRGRDGWRYVGDGRGGRVRYDGWRDVLHIESPAGTFGFGSGGGTRRSCGGGVRIGSSLRPGAV